MARTSSKRGKWVVLTIIVVAVIGAISAFVVNRLRGDERGPSSVMSYFW